VHNSPGEIVTKPNTPTLGPKKLIGFFRAVTPTKDMPTVSGNTDAVHPSSQPVSGSVKRKRSDVVSTSLSSSSSDETKLLKKRHSPRRKRTKYSPLCSNSESDGYGGTMLKSSSQRSYSSGDKIKADRHSLLSSSDSEDGYRRTSRHSKSRSRNSKSRSRSSGKRSKHSSKHKRKALDTLKVLVHQIKK